MHPVLVYGLLFIVSSIALLPVFEAYAFGSFKILLVCAALISFMIGKWITSWWPYDDPMKAEQNREDTIRKSRMYQREIQMLFNIIQPDPKRQPSLRRIHGNLFDYFDLPEATVKKRLRDYFGEDIILDIRQPIIELIQQIQNHRSDWPDVSKD